MTAVLMGSRGSSHPSKTEMHGRDKQNEIGFSHGPPLLHILRHQSEWQSLAIFPPGRLLSSVFVAVGRFTAGGAGHFSRGGLHTKGGGTRGPAAQKITPHPTNRAGKRGLLPGN